jgi:hypothetical protein
VNRQTDEVLTTTTLKTTVYDKKRCKPYRAREWDLLELENVVNGVLSIIAEYGVGEIYAELPDEGTRKSFRKAGNIITEFSSEKSTNLLAMSSVGILLVKRLSNLPLKCSNPKEIQRGVTGKTYRETVTKHDVKAALQKYFPESVLKKTNEHTRDALALYIFTEKFKKQCNYYPTDME